MFAATCGGFILAYYLYQSKNQLKYVVIIPFLLSVGYVCFYGVNGYFSFRFLENTWIRLTTGCVPLKEISFFLDGMEKTGTDIFWFCYFYPLAAVWKGLGDVAVIAMISMFLCMEILLWGYVNKFYEEKRAYRFLLVFMLAAWLGSILYELNIWSIKPFYATPFAGRLIDFIWLAIVYKIFYEKGGMIDGKKF